MYWVLTSQATPLSVGLSFFFMPSVLIGVIGSSSSSNSSSSGSRGILSPLGGLVNREINKKINQKNTLCYQKKKEGVGEVYLYTLRSRRSSGIPTSGSTYSWGFQFFSNDVILYLQYLQRPKISNQKWILHQKHFDFINSWLRFESSNRLSPIFLPRCYFVFTLAKDVVRLGATVI